MKGQTRSQSFPVGVFIVLSGKRGLERARGVEARANKKSVVVESGAMSSYTFLYHEVFCICSN